MSLQQSTEALVTRKMAILDCMGMRDQEVSQNETNRVSQKLTSIELFAGAGGLSVGVARAGFEHLAVVEWNAHACATLRSNRERGYEPVRNWPIMEADVRELDFRDYEGRVDLLAGGPPCQPFSLGGKHRGREDSRDMFPELIRAVRQCKPKAILVENVKGLLRQSFAEYFEYVLKRLENPELSRRPKEDWTEHLKRLQKEHSTGDLGYNLVFRCVNTADYGSAQKRWRVIILGVRKDIGRLPVFPTATHSEDALLWNKWVSGKYWKEHSLTRGGGLREPNERVLRRIRNLEMNLFHPPTDPWRTVRDAFKGLPDPEFCPHEAEKFLNHGHNAGARSYPGHTGSPLDEPAKALKAGDHGVPGGENMMVRPDGSLRYFTVRESARLQDFDDGYYFPGNWTNIMRQLGNAVPSRVGQVMAESLAKTLKETGGDPGRLRTV